MHAAGDSGQSCDCADLVQLHPGVFGPRDAVNPSLEARLPSPCGRQTPRIEHAGAPVNSCGSVERVPLAWPGIQRIFRYQRLFAIPLWMLLRQAQPALRHAHQLAQYRGGVSTGGQGKPDLQGVLLPLPFEVFDHQPQRAAVGIQSHPRQGLYPG